MMRLTEQIPVISNIHFQQHILVYATTIMRVFVMFTGSDKTTTSTSSVSKH